VKRFKCYKGFYDIYTILNLEYCKCTTIRFHCANGLVVLHICAPWEGTLVSTFDIWSALMVNTYSTRGPVMTAKQTPWMHPRCCYSMPDYSPAHVCSVFTAWMMSSFSNLVIASPMIHCRHSPTPTGLMPCLFSSVVGQVCMQGE